ncbi:MAG: hypothetical protein ACO3RV_08145, partial [Luteolibacter sp.]
WEIDKHVEPATVDEIWSRYPMAKQDPLQRHQLAREIARRLCSVEYPPGRQLWQRAMDAANPPSRALWMLAAWFTQAEMVSRYRDQYFPNARYFVIGHFHRRGCWTKHGIQTLNTGCFVNPGRAACVELDGSAISYARIIESKHEIRREQASFYQSIDIHH